MDVTNRSLIIEVSFLAAIDWQDKIQTNLYNL